MLYRLAFRMHLGDIDRTYQCVLLVTVARHLKSKFMF
jgi:hypothetical protein